MENLKRPVTVGKTLYLTTALTLIFGLFTSDTFAQTAGFTANLTTGCEPLTVNFTNQSVNATSYWWSFGNGNTSTMVNPTTVYTGSGYYTVTLVAISASGRDTLVRTNYIYVPASPIPDFTAQTLSGCAGGNQISFTNFSTNATGYTWDFGDGNYSSLVNPTHTYMLPGTYTVKLIATNVAGCTRVKNRTAYITIFPLPVASFSVSQQTTCDTNTVFQFNSTSTGASSYAWSFGNGAASTLPNPTQSFHGTGTFSVSLIVTSANGCADTVIQPSFINISPPPVPVVTVNSQSGCAPFGVSFNSTTADAASWLWNFGDGSTSTQEDPLHVYQNAGTYSVSLSVVTASGCTTSVVLPSYININRPPVAAFSSSVSTGCKPLSVPFSNNSTGAVSYAWNFGNGTTSVLQSPSALYTASSTYSVSLVATSANGCSDTITHNLPLTVNTITAFFTGNPTTGCAPLPVVFTGSSSPAAVTWSWNFGDGSIASTQNPSHTFTSTGNYNITLAVTSAAGCHDTLVKTSYIKVVTDTTPYTVPDTMQVCLPPGIVGFTAPNPANNAWVWSFGDGDSAFVRSPVHHYTTPGTYTVTLNTSMAGGCSRSYNPFAIVKVLESDTFPIMAITSTPCGPYTVQLSDPSSNISTYLWEFGDGTTSNLPNPSHTYSAPGTYNILLHVVGNNGCESGLSTVVNFGHANPITVSSINACNGDPINFGLNPVSQFVTATWDFGDGTHSNLLQPVHSYANAGFYPVSVNVVDLNGCAYTYNYPTLISIGNPQPSFTLAPPSGCIPVTVQFTNTSVGASSYHWDFGGAGSSTAANPSFTFSTAGLYDVTLQATMNGCTRTYTMPNAVTANQAVVFFNYTPNTGCLPLTVSFNDNSINPVSWFWSFGDGTTSTLQNPVHTYTAVPDSNIKLTIVDINGCQKTISRQKVQPVIPQIVVSDSVGCRPLVASFSTPTTASSYLWNFGDGSTSTLQNPNHLYTVVGSYSVSLTCTLASGCTTTTIDTALVHVNAPQSEFMSPTVAVCAPSLVNFVNQSVGAVSWIWDFGDGATSTNENPSHIYHLPGTYTVSLISFSAEGCTDTLVKVDYVTVPGTVSQFAMASSINCFNTAAQFVDQSIGATSWFWNFGDGFTSNLQNPTHLYLDSGSYTVTLITSNNTGCSSFFTLPNPITIHPLPVAQATVSSVTGCHPLHVDFANQSVNAAYYHWSFGNGDTSNVAVPAYTYTTPGTYYVQLIAYTSVGCSDTFDIATPVVVNPTPVASFNTSGVMGCNPYTVTYTNTSSYLSSPSYSWTLGNGSVLNSASPSTTYLNAGSYNVNLVVTNTEGCSDTASTQIVVNLTPAANAIMANTSGCEPILVNFTDLSLNADSIVWNFGDGTVSSVSNPSHQYTAGSYQPFLVAMSAAGCRDTFMLPGQVLVHPVPVASFTVNHTGACSGSTFSFLNQSSPASGLAFQWNVAGISSSDQNPSFVITNPGHYDASLIVVNQFGCSDTLLSPDYVEVYDTIPPAESPIMSVSVVDDSSVEIIWKNTEVTDFGMYRLYRLNNATGAYNQIFTQTSIPVIGPNSVSNFIDAGLNTLNHTYTYKVQTEDRCAYSIPFESLTAHTTINISATASGNDIHVNWTPYGGCTVATYELQRLNLQTGSIEPVAVLPGNVTSYNDEDFPCPFTYSYRVKATDLCGNNFVSWSDTAAATPANMLAGQKVDIVRSTVVDDRDVLTEWAPPVLHPERVKEYRIMRSSGDNNFTEVARVPAGVHLFTDSDVDVHKTEYFYRISIVTDCDLIGEQSNQSSSIYLQSKYDYNNFKSTLWWTPYNQWDTGVDHYDIQKLNSNGTWELIRTVNGSTLESNFDE